MTNTPIPDEGKMQIQFEDEQEELLEDCDAADIFAVIGITADYLDIDVIEFLDAMLQGIQYKFGPESVLQDILESSQSNLDESLLNLRRAFVLDNKIADL
jgi:hypothetical protein